MAQMKEQIKTPVKELNEMEISNLPDVKFKAVVIRMLQEPTGYFNSTKKTQGEMKVTLSEIKKIYRESTVEWDEVKNQINDLGQKREKNIQSEQPEEKRI